MFSSSSSFPFPRHLRHAGTLHIHTCQTHPSAPLKDARVFEWISPSLIHLSGITDHLFILFCFSSQVRSFAYSPLHQSYFFLYLVLLRYSSRFIFVVLPSRRTSRKSCYYFPSPALSLHRTHFCCPSLRTLSLQFIKLLFDQLFRIISIYYTSLKCCHVKP